MGYVPKSIHLDHPKPKEVNKKKVIYDKDMDYSFTHNMRDGPI